MATAWNKKQGGTQSRPSAGRVHQDQGGEPTTGFVQSPKSERQPGGPGQGIGNSRKGIK